MTATLTVTSSWSLPLAMPGTTAISLYPLGQISEALPPRPRSEFKEIPFARRP